MVVSRRTTWGPAGTNVPIAGKPVCGCCARLNGHTLGPDEKNEGYGGAVVPETAQGVLCGRVHLVVRSWDACLPHRRRILFLTACTPSPSTVPERAECKQKLMHW